MSKERRQELPPILFESVVELAKETALRDGGHVPTLVIDATHQPVILQIPELASTHEMRVEQMFIAGMALAQHAHVGRLRQIVFVSEGWMSEPQEGQLPEIPPSQDPNRREVLFITGYEPRTGQTRGVILEMIRDQEETLRELREFATPGVGEEQVKSPLVDAFLRGFSAGNVDRRRHDKRH